MNSFVIYEYSPLLMFITVGIILSVVLLGLSYLVANLQADYEKLSAYECGFDPFQDARLNFEVRFYLVAILFIIFDLEVSFLFPWAVTLDKITFMGFWTMIVFLLILTIGFVYEWWKGAREWE